MILANRTRILSALIARQRGIFTFPLILAGIVFPIEFLSIVDGLWKSQTLVGILKTFGRGWLVYIFIGLVFVCVMHVAVSLITSLTRRSMQRTAVESILKYCAIIWVAYSLADAAHNWIATFYFPDLRVPYWQRLARLLALLALLNPIVLKAERIDRLVGDLLEIGKFFNYIAAFSIPLLIYSMIQISPGPRANAPSNAPNVILISVDTLSAKHMSVYGYGRSTTPNLERFASQANVFTHYYANSNFTPPTINSLLNGVRPWTHRVIHVVGDTAFDRAIAESGLVASMRRHGYETHAISTNLWAAPTQNGSAPYFDSIDGGQVKVIRHLVSKYIFPDVAQLRLNTLLCIEAVIELALVNSGTWTETDHYDPEVAFRKTRERIVAAQPGVPQFVWTHLMPPHDPYAPPPPFLQRFDKTDRHLTRFNSTPPVGFSASSTPDFPERYVGRYDESVAYIDYHIGMFIDWLKLKGLYDSSLIVITADHGESFSNGYGQHGGILLTDDIIRIPLLIKLPKQQTGSHIDVPCEEVDLLPTLVESVGSHATGSLEGRSLLPAMRGEHMPDVPIFSMSFERSDRFGQLSTGTVAVIDGPWKFVKYFGYKETFPAWIRDSLYESWDDNATSSNVIDKYPQRAKDMNTLIEAQLDKKARAFAR